MSNKDNMSYYDLVANYFAQQPKEVEGLNNSAYLYWYDKLFKLIYSLYKFKNIPESWNKDYLKQVLFENGYIIVTEVAGFKEPLALHGSYHGIDMYGYPTKYRINNAILGSIEGALNGDSPKGLLMFLEFSKGSFKTYIPTVTHYALLLAQCDCSINVSLMNSRLAHIFEVSNDAEKKSVQKLYDEVSSGKPAVFIKKGSVNDSLYEKRNDFMNVRNTYIANDILLTQRQIMNNFLTEIGVNNANSDKRERLITDEVNANNIETQLVINKDLETLKECIDRINRRFNLNIDVEMSYNGGELDEFKQSNETVQ